MDGDDEFQVSKEALLSTDFDDDATFNPSEDEEDPDELDNLNDDADIPLEQLRAMYGYGAPTVNDSKDSPSVVDNDQNLGMPPLQSEKDSAGDNLLADVPPLLSQVDGEEAPLSGGAWLPALNEGSTSLFDLTHVSSRRAHSDDGSSSSDEDYEPAPPSPTLDWRKEIRLGDDYQADIPLFCAEPDSNADEAVVCDILMWSPGEVPDNDVLDYLMSALNALSEEEAAARNIDGRSEWALQHLMKYNHNCKTALKELPQWNPPVTPWTEEECSGFEDGLRMYGKNFFLIQRSQVSHRSINELIQFYYLWKKTERHDYFKRISGPRHGRKRTAGPSGLDERSDSDSDSQLNSAVDTDVDSQAPSAVSSMPTSPSTLSLSADHPRLASHSRIPAPASLSSSRDSQTHTIAHSLTADARHTAAAAPALLPPPTAMKRPAPTGESSLSESRVKIDHLPSDIQKLDHPHPTPPDSPLEPPSKKPYTG